MCHSSLYLSTVIASDVTPTLGGLKSSSDWMDSAGFLGVMCAAFNNTTRYDFPLLSSWKTEVIVFITVTMGTYGISEMADFPNYVTFMV